MTTEKKIFEHKFKFYIIEQDPYEPDDIFQYRVNFIISNLEKDNYNNLVKKSRLLSNINNYGCEYNSVVESIVKN